MKHLALLALVGSIFVFGQTLPVPAQEQSAPVEAAESLQAEWSNSLDEIAVQLDQPNISDEALSRIRGELDTIRALARDRLAEGTPDVAQVEEEIEALGPPPAEGEEPEPESIAAQRQELKDRLAEIAGPLKEAELIIARVGLINADLVELRRARFAERILARGPSPLSPSVWARALPELRTIATSISRSADRYVGSPEFEIRMRDSLGVVLGAVLLAVILVWPVHRWLLRRYGRDPSVEKPDFLRTVRATLVTGATLALLPTAAAALIYAALLSGDLLTEIGTDIAQAVFFGIVLFTWTIAFFRASLSPTQPNWRIVPVSTTFARGVRGIVIGLALVFAIDIVVSEVIVTYDARLAVTALRDYFLSVVVAGLLLTFLLRQTIWKSTEEPFQPRWSWLRLLGAFALIVLLLLGAFGYVALARYAVTQLVLTAGLVLLILILHRLGREFIEHALSAESWVKEQMHDTMEIGKESIGRAIYWLGFAYDFVLILFGVVVGLFIWGADRKDVAEWSYQALFGFEIGNFTFSLSSIAIATVLFVGLVFATRFIQRILAERVLPQTQLDSGIRQSIKTGVGYVGIIIAAAIGISALGLDLSNLAILAGALSVGIGFGLQNVVNNFVSGLILLVERPVQVGDWVVIGDKQGYVKRIKVRATEIQTFDRASVFVPNSQLISEAVTNWTYADKMGRVIIPIGVAYGSELRKVIEILLEIGRSHPEVLEQPAPTAMFRGFGDSALNFELRCFLADVERTISVTSDLCLLIDDAFREAGIEIPFPQQDVYVKQLGSEEVSKSKAMPDK